MAAMFTCGPSLFISTENALPFLEKHKRDYDRDRGLYLLEDAPGASLVSTFKRIAASSIASDVTDRVKIIKFGQGTDAAPQSSRGMDPGMRMIVRSSDDGGPSGGKTN